MSGNMEEHLTSYRCVEAHYDLGQPEVWVEASESPSTPSSKLTTISPKCQDYKPTALRWWYHGFLITCLATFLGLTEYAIQTLLDVNQEDPLSQLWSRSIEDHHIGDQQFVPERKKSPYQRTARISSNLTSTQAETYSVNNGDSQGLDSSSSTLAASTQSIFSSPTTFPSSIERLLSVSETTEKGPLVPLTTYSNTSDRPHPLSTDALNTSHFWVPPILATSRDAYLHDEPTSLTVTPIPKLMPSAADSSHLSLSMTTTTTTDLLNPASPSAAISKVDGIISENTWRSDDKPIVTVIEQTKTWAPGQTTIELSSTGSDGKAATQLIKTTFPGGTSVYQATKTLPPEVHGESLTPIRQNEAWSSIKATLERTTTDSRGHVFVQTVTTAVPAESGFLESTVTVRPGESLVAVPMMITTKHGGLTQVMQTTYVDFEGRTTTSSYTTVIGGDSTLATHTFFIATSLHAGYTVIIVPTAVPTTEGGTVQVVQTVYTDSQGPLTTSLYTRTVNGTPTLMTIPVVIATPVSPGDKQVTLPTVIPTTIGGTTKVLKATSTDSLGHTMTFSYVTVEGGTPTSTTVWTVVPSPTSTCPTNPDGRHDTGGVAVVVYGLGLRDYMLGTFLPTILAATIAYPLKLININARLMQPFHELATTGETDGVSAEASIFLRFYDWTGALSLPRSAKLRQPIIVISDFLVLGAALLAPVAAETVSVHVPDGCDSGCYGTLGVTTIPGRVLEALLATMMALLVALIVLLNIFRWETGVRYNPWGIAGMASLGLSPEIRDKIRKIPCDSSGPIKENMILKAIAGSKYALDEYCVSSSPGIISTRGYGIVVRTSNDKDKKLVKVKRPGNGKTSGPNKAKEKKKTQPFALLTWWGRGILLFIFACVLIIATYYETTRLNSGFERFMDSHGFGIRFLFTALGVIIGSCMETFFRSVAIILPYQQLSRCALPAERSILLSPPTNAFYGLYSAFRQRSLFLGAVAFTSILAELFLPVTLLHVPFSHLDTYETHRICAWGSISILALMILTILYSFFIRWPHMPVDPRTIAGAMFYVCDSGMLGTMEGMTTLGKKERDSIMRAQRLSYKFASSEGVSGKERMSVDICGERGGSNDDTG